MTFYVVIVTYKLMVEVIQRVVDAVTLISVVDSDYHYWLT